MSQISPTLSARRTDGAGLYRWLLAFAFLLVAMNLRAPLTSLPSVIADVRAGLGISSSVAGLFTSIPVLCFGILTPFASFLIGRLGIERGLLLMLGGIALGTVVRPLAGMETAILGTIILGAAMTLGNIVILMVIARDFRHQMSLMTGIYVTAMGLGSMFSASLTVPFAAWWGWRIALGCWALLAVLAIVFWFGIRYGRCRLNQPLASLTQADPSMGATVSSSGQNAAVSHKKPLSHHPALWLLAVAFACHTFIFYGITAWLPDFLVQTAAMSVGEAGLAASCFQLFGIFGCLAVPLLHSVGRMSHARLMLLVAACWFCMPAGLMIAPRSWLIWTLIGGVGTGGTFTVIFMIVMKKAGSLDENRRMSAFVQGVGYTVASTSPAITGALHQWLDSWFMPFSLLAGMSVFMAFCGVRSLRQTI